MIKLKQSLIARSQCPYPQQKVPRPLAAQRVVVVVVEVVDAAGRASAVSPSLRFRMSTHKSWPYQ